MHGNMYQHLAMFSIKDNVVASYLFNIVDKEGMAP